MAKELKGSKRGKLDMTDAKKLVTGAVIALTSAALAYTSSDVVPLLEEAGGDGKLLLAAVIGVLINAARKWLSDNTVKE